MHRESLSLLRCPHTHDALEIDALRAEEAEVVEAFLVSAEARRVYPVVAGIAALPLDFVHVLRAQGSVWWRTPAHDPRMVRFLRRQAGYGYIKVAFEDIVRHYRDLATGAPEGYDTTRDPEDLGLLSALDEAGVQASDTAVAIGTGVGRRLFDLAALGGRVLGFDTNLACVRRVRNIAVTREDFFLPADPGLGVKTILLDLGSLARERVDVALADLHALPAKTGCADLVVVAEGGDAALAEGRRLLASGGRLVTRGDAPATWRIASA